MVSFFHDKTLNKSGIDLGLRFYLSQYNHYMKKYLTHKEMIEFLKENKKIIVSDEYSEIYSERNYVSIINPYKTVFSGYGAGTIFGQAIEEGSCSARSPDKIAM